METVNALGRRKEAVARVYVNEGSRRISRLLFCAISFSSR